MKKLNKTDPDKLITLLRSEVGEIIESWIVYNYYNTQAYKLQTTNILEDQQNPELQVLNITRRKFKNDIILRITELSSADYKTINFHYASDKFKVHKEEIKSFRNYLKEKNLIFNRNKNIAHKAFSTSRNQLTPNPVIRNIVLLKSIGWAIRIMKKFDEVYYGRDYRKIWKEERKLRYKLDMPAGPKYMLLSLHVNL